MKRIVTVQDISCVGRCSMTVALPVISAMGVEAAVLPTALLSTHTLFPDPSFTDLTGQIPAITAHWVVFRQLDENDFRRIARLLMGEYVDSMAERGVKLVIEDSAVELLAGKAMGGEASARDLRNLIRKEVEDRLANLVIETAGELPGEIVVTTEEADGEPRVAVKSCTPALAE